MLPSTSDHAIVIDAFVAPVVHFCDWCEAPPNADSDTHRESLEVRKLLANLYARALNLPEVEVTDWEPEGERRSAEQLKSIWPKLATLPLSYYQAFTTPSELTETPGMGDLTDDLQDIYGDLKEGLSLHENGHQALAVWAWRFSFETHWGEHATGALNALQTHR